MQEDEEEQEGGRWEAELSLQALPLPPERVYEQTGSPGDQAKTSQTYMPSKARCSA